MDPLSVSASIVALLQLSSTIISYLSDVKGGPKELQKIRLEICSILPILSILQDQAEQAKNDDSWSFTLLSLNVPYGPIQQFRAALEQLELKMAPVVGWRKVGKAFTWPFEKDEIQRILNTIERQKLLFALARQNDHIGLSKAIKGDVENVHKKVDEISKEVARLQVSEKHHKIGLWLAGPDPSLNYNRALKRRHEGTGSWLIENDVFRDWKHNSRPGSIIWLYGIPGCGKTILCSTVLEHVLDSYHPRPNDAVLYFFFDFNDIDKRQHEGMICSLLSQLVMQCASMPPVLETLYSSSIDGKRKPTHEALLKTLHQVTTIFDNVFIILDALDECEERPGLLADIEQLVSWRDSKLRILVTSRREKDIEDSLMHLTNDKNRICIQSTLVNADIRAYVRNQLQSNKKLQRWQTKPKVQMEIEDTLMKKADGMFRWVACQLDSLGSCLTLVMLRKALAALPRTLNDTYARILCNINEDYQQYALHILRWLAFSVRPLGLREISEVVAIDVNDTPQFDPQRRLPDPRDVFEICSSLITITSETEDIETSGPIVLLAHFSVKEFLVSDVIRQGQAVIYSLQEIDCHLSIARDCLAYLLHSDEEGFLIPQVIPEYPLADYISKYWTVHARVAEKIDPTLCQTYISTKGKAFTNWVRLSDYYPIEWPEEVASPLYYASLAGLLESVRLLLDEGADINAQAGGYGSALIAASSYGHVEVVELLLEKGAHVDAMDDMWGTALCVAAGKGHIKIVQMLLENGADANAQSKVLSETVLLIAIENSNEDIAQLLIENGADVFYEYRPETFSFGRNALEMASFLGLQKVVELILDKSDTIEVQGEKYSQALAKASKTGQQKIAQILLDKGAVISARAMETAVLGGSMEILQMLINHGGDLGDLDLQDAQGRALCHHASAQNNVDGLGILLKFGSDLTVIDKQGRTCLHHAACSYNSESTVTWLLKKGFDPNLPDRDGWTPLHWAAKAGDFDAIETLEEAGANFSAERIMGWTPNDVAEFHDNRIFWKTNTTMDGGLERLESNPVERTDTTSLEADGRGLGAQVSPGVRHDGDFCDGCYVEIFGTIYKCENCSVEHSFYYCFKCKQSSIETHPGHTFIEIPFPSLRG